METTQVEMPYGTRFLDIEVPTSNLQKIYRPKNSPVIEDTLQATKNVLKNPIKTAPLSTLIEVQDRIAIIIDDITRPTPNELLVSTILKEIPTPRENIELIVATGLHRANTEAELTTMLGPEIVKNVKITNHNAFDQEGLTYIGTTSGGTIVTLNNAVHAADKIITTGHIEPHEFAGFTGGRKSIFPGVVGAEGINHNHRLEHIDHSKAKIGVLEGNPIHEDMVEAAEMVGIDFMVNVVVDSKDNQIMKVVAGDFRAAHQQGVEYYKKYAQVEIEPADIVITSTGAPLDINFYQAMKAIFAAEFFVKRGGVIIHLAECPNGLGTPIFSEWITSFSSPEDVIERIHREGYRGDIDHCYMLAKILRKNEVIVVSPHKQIHEIKRAFLPTMTSSVNAIDIVLSNRGADSTIAILPYAQRLIPKY